MSDSACPLPSFSDPPVVEVALSVQFETVKGLRTPLLGLLWNEFRATFPRIEEHPPLPSVIERFGAKPAAFHPPLQLQMIDAPPTPRCWFLTEDGTQLIQVQHDRFVHNWRKKGKDQPYPRYSSLRESFEEELDRLQGFFRRENLGDLSPNQCEVTYLNHIAADKEWTRFGELDRVLTVFSGRYSEPFLKEPEEARVALKYVIPNTRGEPSGRLHVEVKPAFRSTDNQPILVMSLTARNRPEDGGVDGAMQSLDIGHEWVVRGFASVTTQEMHGTWERR